MNILNLHRRLIYEYAYGKRQTSERHNVDGLPGCPKKQDSRGQSEGDIRNHNERTAPVSKEEQDNQPRQNSAQKRFADQAADSVRYISRLVKGQLYIHIVRDRLLEYRQRCLYSTDDG